MSYKRNLLPKMAIERLQNNPQALFVDVRTKAEHRYVGYPENSILIPWIDDPDWEPNPEAFSDSVMQELDGRENLLDTEIILKATWMKTTIVVILMAGDMTVCLGLKAKQSLGWHRS